MARFRTIKPSFWTSSQIVECSPTARLMFIGMWNFADDYGNLPANLKTIKMQIFPGDDFNPSEIGGWIIELINQELIVEYQVDAKPYWHITGWHHQKVEKPSRQYPGPELAEQSPNSRRTVADASPAECKGVEGSVKEGKVKEGSGSVTRAQEDEIEFFENADSPTPPHQSSAYDTCHAHIVSWGRADEWKKLREIGGKANFTGEMKTEISRFISHHLAKDSYREKLISDPVTFLLEQLPGWLSLPAAKKNRQQRSGAGPPNLRFPLSESQILHELRTRFPRVTFTPNQIARLSTAASEAIFFEWANGMAKAFQNPDAPRSGNAIQVDLKNLGTT